MEVLIFFKIKLMHLTPNLVLMLAVFLHLCEAYVKVLFDLGIFCNIYTLKKTKLPLILCKGLCQVDNVQGA